MPRLSFASNPFTEHAGRLGTRVKRGQPAKRWEDSIFDARTYVTDERTSGLLRYPSKRKTKQKYRVKEVLSLSHSQVNRFDELADLGM